MAWTLKMRSLLAPDLAIETIQKDQYVAVSANGATSVPHHVTDRPPDSIWARALEDIEAGHHGRVREVSPKAD